MCIGCAAVALSTLFGPASAEPGTSFEFEGRAIVTSTQSLNWELSKAAFTSPSLDQPNLFKEVLLDFPY
jgi:hypothetical protein